MNTNITVQKRDGSREPLSLEKWQAQIAKVCRGTADVSQSMIEITAQLHFYDGITTKEIDGITLRAIVDLIDVESNPEVGHVNYQYVAGSNVSACYAKMCMVAMMCRRCGKSYNATSLLGSIPRIC